MKMCAYVRMLMIGVLLSLQYSVNAALGDDCSTDPTICDTSNNEICTGTTCVCDDGFYERGTSCVSTSEAVVGLSVSGVTSRGASLTWKRPVNTNGDLYKNGIEVFNSSTCVQRINIECAVCKDSMNLLGSFEFICERETYAEISQSNLNNAVFEVHYDLVLLPDTVYEVFVAAYNEEGKGTTSNETILTQQEAPGDPTEFRYVSKTSESVELMWKPPEPRPGVTAYEISVYEWDEDMNQYKTFRNSSTLGFYKVSINITGLSSYWKYRFEMFARTSRGVSNTVILPEVTTAESASEAIVDLSVSGVTSRVATLTWRRPVNTMGALYKYGIEVFNSSTCVQRINIECAVCKDSMNALGLFEISCERETDTEISQSNLNNVNFDVHYRLSLLPDTLYRVDVAAYNGGGKGKIRNETILTQQDAPGDPTEFRYVSKTSESVELRWNPPEPRPGVTTYNISVYEWDGDENHYKSFKNVNTLGFYKVWINITGLSSHWKYRFEMYARTSRGVSNTVILPEVTTAESASEAIIGLSVSGVTSRVATLTWRRPVNTMGALYKYGIEVFNSSTCVQRINIECAVCKDSMNLLGVIEISCERVTYTEISKTFFNNVDFDVHYRLSLLPDTIYDVVVAAYNGGGKGKIRNETILTQQEAPGDPTELRYVSKTSESVELMWNHPEPRPGVTSYEISVYEWDGDENHYKSFKNVNTLGFYKVAINITGLSSYWKYRFEMFARTSRGVSNTVILLEVTTADSAPGDPTEFRYVSKTSESVELMWNPPDQRSGLISYMISVYEWDEDTSRYTDFKNISVLGLNKVSINITGLSSYWKYRFEMYAKTSKGVSNTVNVPEVTTEESAPTEVENLEHQTVDGVYNQYQLSWRCPPQKDGRNGMIRSATVITSSFTLSADINPEIGAYNFHNSDCTWSEQINVTPEFNYTFEVYISNSLKGESTTIQRYMPAGPARLSSASVPADKQSDSTELKTASIVCCPSCILNRKNGIVKTSGVIVCKGSCHNYRRKRQTKTMADYETFQTWGQSQKNSFNTPYRATPPEWLSSFKDSNAIKYIIGNDTKCSQKAETTFCNGPLQQGTIYKVIVFACTSVGCDESEEISISTATDDKLPWTITIIAAVAATVALVVMVVVLLVVYIKVIRPRSQKNRRPKYVSETTDKDDTYEEIADGNIQSVIQDGRPQDDYYNMRDNPPRSENTYDQLTVYSNQGHHDYGRIKVTQT